MLNDFTGASPVILSSVVLQNPTRIICSQVLRKKSGVHTELPGQRPYFFPTLQSTLVASTLFNLYIFNYPAHHACVVSCGNLDAKEETGPERQ